MIPPNFVVVLALKHQPVCMGYLMKKILTAVVFIVTAMLFASCLTLFPVMGNGIARTKSIALSNFTAVDYSGVSDFVFVQTSGECKAVITIDDNLMDYIEVELIGTTLRISTKPMVSIAPTVHDVVTVYAPNVGNFALSGTGYADLGKINADSLSISNSGTGNVSAIISLSGSLRYSNSGTGNTVLEGSAVSLDLNSTGTGKFDARALALQTATVYCSGTGHSYVQTNSGISGTISGTGNLYYYGSGNANVSMTGIGRVISGD